MKFHKFCEAITICCVVGCWMAMIPSGPLTLMSIAYFSGGFGVMALLFWIESKFPGAVTGRMERPAPWPDPPAGPMPNYYCDPESFPPPTRAESFEIQVTPLASYVEVPEYQLYRVTLLALGDFPVMEVDLWAIDSGKAVEIAMAMKGQVMVLKGRAKLLSEESSK